MANSAGNPANPTNEGQVDSGRGTSFVFPFNKAGRKTSKVGTPTAVPNSNSPDANVRKVSDPRLV